MKPRGSVLKLFTVAAGALLILLFALFMLTRSNSNPVTSAQAVAPAGTTNATPVAGSPNLETQLVSQSVPATLTTEDELENLRRMRAVANESDRSKILQTFSKTEKKYSADYRIPYERAKLVVLDHEKNFHEEAFAALARAAQKAINSGKAGEMLQSLKKDSDGDFHKLSHGHREWTQLQKALKSKDVSVLQGNEGL